MLLLAGLLAGCAEEDAAPTTAATAPIAEGTIPTVAPAHQTPTAMEPGTTPQPPAPPAARSAPPQRVRALRFADVKVFPAGNGTFAGEAAMTNTGSSRLDALIVSWKILDAAGHTLDQGQLDWPSLEPGETAAIDLTGTVPYNDAWQTVRFEYAEAGVGQ